MPAIQHRLQPIEIADALQAMCARDPQTWREHKVVMTPFYDQFAVVETPATSKERDARYLHAITRTIFGALAPHNLLASQVGNQRQRLEIGDKFGRAVGIAVNGEDVFASNLDSFLRSDAVNRAAAGAITFELVAPSRPHVSSYKYDPADADHCCV